MWATWGAVNGNSAIKSCSQLNGSEIVKARTEEAYTLPWKVVPRWATAQLQKDAVRSECCRQVSKPPCWQELPALDSQLNKYSRSKQETVISLVHPGKPALHRRSCITCGTAPDWASRRARHALEATSCLKDATSCMQQNSRSYPQPKDNHMQRWLHTRSCSIDIQF